MSRNVENWKHKILIMGNDTYVNKIQFNLYMHHLKS